MKRNHYQTNNILDSIHETILNEKVKNDSKETSNYPQTEKKRKITSKKTEIIVGKQQSFSYQKEKNEAMEIDDGLERHFSDAAENENSDESYLSENDESQSDSSESEHSENQNKNKITQQTNKKSILKKSAAAAGVDLTEKAKSKSKKKNVNFQEEEAYEDEEMEEELDNALVEDILPCREKEQDFIKNYIKKGFATNGNYSSLYISGMPGTGKTACVHAVIKKLRIESQNSALPPESNTSKRNTENGKPNTKKTKTNLNSNEMDVVPESPENPRFSVCFVNGMKVINQNNVFKLIYESIFTDGRNKNPQKTISLLDQFFKSRETHNFKSYLKDPSNPHLILVIDEIDCLLTKKQVLLYNIFNWTTYPNSKLIIISISNTLDLPEKLMPKIASRMGNTRLIFKPYQLEELNRILAVKVVSSGNFSDDALRLCCMKVASINGDLRRVLQICRRAKEIFDAEKNSTNNNIDLNFNKSNSNNNNNSNDNSEENENNLSNSNNNKKNEKNETRKIEKQHIIKACAELFDSKVVGLIRDMKVYEKVILLTIIEAMRIKNDNKIKLSVIYERHSAIALKLKITRSLKFEEFRMIIYNLNKLKIINFADNNCENFIENSIYIKFYTDELISALQDQDEYRSIIEGDFSNNFGTGVGN